MNVETGIEPSHKQTRLKRTKSLYTISSHIIKLPKSILKDLPKSQTPSQPRRPHRIIKVIHLVPRVVSKQTRVRPLAVPSPLVSELRRQPALHHVDDIFAQNREELEAVEVAAGGNVQALGGGVRRDDEVGAGGEGVPVNDWVSMLV
jgi:hypothetical protein